MPLTVDLCGYDKLDGAGGPLVWLCRFPQALREQGVEVRIRLLSWHRPQDGVAFQTLRADGFDVVGREFEDTNSNMRWLLSQLIASPPDVFVPNLVTPAFYAARWARAAGIPTVGILHSDDEFYRAIQSEFVFGDPRFAVSTIVCVSHELERQVLNHEPTRTTVERIPYGVPTPDLAAAQLNGRLRLGFVGRLAEEQKRISEVTAALCRVVQEVPGTTAIIYGDGPDKKHVQQILAGQPDGVAVTLGGNISSQHIQEQVVATCDVIVLLSDYEGLPISLLEAMACGVVPVCLNIRSGIPELIQDGVNGLLVNDRGDDFVQAIRRLQTEPLLWQRLSTAAKSQVRTHNSLSITAARWAEMAGRLHQQTRKSMPFRMPSHFDLPPIHPALAGEDARPELSSTRWYARPRVWGGLIKRMLGGTATK